MCMHVDVIAVRNRYLRALSLDQKSDEIDSN